MANLFVLAFFAAILLATVTIGLFFYALVSWNIPIAVLRFTGNKQRPTMMLRKGRKKMIHGVPHLWVRGYAQPVRDFKAENYYPSPKTKWGGLILWEFEDGWLTPTAPRGVKLSRDAQRIVHTAIDTLNEYRPVGFEFDEEIHTRLKLKIVDDVDAEFAVEQLFRQENQYSAGFFEWLSKHSTAVLSVVVVGLVLVGFIVWLDKSPQYMAQCASIARETVLDAIRDRGAAGIVPPG